MLFWVKTGISKWKDRNADDADVKDFHGFEKRVFSRCWVWGTIDKFKGLTAVWMRKYLVIACLLIGASSAGQTVFKTPSGAKYHLASCRMVKNVSEEISVATAKELGLMPCKICKPANIYTASESVVHKAKGQDKTVQCKGLTKSGTRCKHKTRIGNGYCFQHQPK